MYSRIIFGILLCCISNALWGQGSLLLVGGGSEDLDAGGWSEAPYGWVVQQAANRRIAVISVNDESSAIPDYFVSLGATESHNIKIDSRALAEDAAMYDSLMGYDGFFFKGGDQSRYYEYWKNSEVSQAMMDKYAAGGVLAGTSAGLHILSGVVFTAEEGSVYPEQGLENINTDRFQLKDDFTQNFPGYVFDSHFIERGRALRLLAFLAQQQLIVANTLVGLGVDDQTALAIDSEGLATVYGTAGVELIWADAEATQAVGDQFAAQGWQSQRLLAGDQRNLRADSLVSLAGEGLTSVAVMDESVSPTVYLMGGEELDVYEEVMDKVLVAAGANPHVLIVHDEGNNPSISFQNLAGASVTTLSTAASENEATRADLRNAIRSADVLVWKGNTMDNLQAFLDGGETGLLLSSHALRSDVTHVFVGEDSRLAGPRVVTNHRSQANAAYRGTLNIVEGMGILRNTVVMPNAIDLSTTDYYENTTAALPWMLTQHRLQYGLYLLEDSYVRIGDAEGMNVLAAEGRFAAVLLENTSTRGGTADRRQVVSYDAMEYSVLPAGNQLALGMREATTPEPYTYELERPVGLTAIQVEDGVQLQWSNLNTQRTVTGYVIGRAIGDSDDFPLLPVSVSTTSYIDTSAIASGTTYRYRVLASDIDGASEWSEIVQVSTVTDLPSVTAPWQVYPNPVSGNQLSLVGKGTPVQVALRDLQGRTWAATVAPLGDQQWRITMPPGQGLQYLCFFTATSGQTCLPIWRQP